MPFATFARRSELDHTQGLDSPGSSTAVTRFWLPKAVGQAALALSHKPILP